MSDSVPLFLFGNGLSIALSPEFSLKRITQKFISGLEGDDKAYFSTLCGGEDNLDFDDFENNFSLIEGAYGSVKKYKGFIESSAGQIFLSNFGLTDPQLGLHEEIIKSLYNRYIFQILELIHGNVTKFEIEFKLKGFTTFLNKLLSSSSKGYVFTLNYDLLAETILLEELGTGHFSDFCTPTGFFKGTEIAKYDFDPALSYERYGEDFTTSNVELHHLHGSLSMFYDYVRNKAVKFRSDEIFTNQVYKTISAEGWPLYPAIITGGGKSLKVVEYPFEFYHRKLKDLSTYGSYNKLFVVGYSFRDDHINDMIIRWLKSVEDYTQGLLIVDFQPTEEGAKKFKAYVRSKIRKRPAIPDSCFEFGGANSIRDVRGTEAKKDNIL